MAIINSTVPSKSYDGLNCIGYEQILVSNTVATLTFSERKMSKTAIVVCEANVNTPPNDIAVRFREDSNNPAPSIGMPLNNFGIYEIRQGTLVTDSFKAISENGQTQILHVQYYA